MLKSHEILKNSLSISLKILKKSRNSLSNPKPKIQNEIILLKKSWNFPIFTWKVIENSFKCLNLFKSIKILNRFHWKFSKKCAKIFKKPEFSQFCTWKVVENCLKMLKSHEILQKFSILYLVRILWSISEHLEASWSIPTCWNIPFYN